MGEKRKVSKRQFKAEVKQLLDILAHSLYTNREIFLRELISNASDALDKLSFETNRGTVVEDPDLPFEIRISFDKENRQISVSDTGVGMSEEEVIANIGTIARSGSAEFLREASADQGKLETLIGQFGVGFYSVFMAADRVVLRSKSYRKGEPAIEWQSDGMGAYQVSRAEGEHKRGTTVEIHLKEDAVEFAEKSSIEGIIKRHSNFIQFPIYVDNSRVNTVAALWREPKSSVTADQYVEFYKFLAHDTDEPLETIHLSVDAPIQFNSLFFIPKRSRDLFDFSRERWGLDLYVRRVLIQRENKDVLPEYLGFVRGVVDSEDLPLNISRETFQENRLVAKIAATVTKHILSQLETMVEKSPEKYEEFWREHGRRFKLGYADFVNRERFTALLRFNSSSCEDESGLISFQDYVERSRDGQKDIYYVFGTGRDAIALNPHMEMFSSKGIEVLYLYDPIDEFVMDAVRQFKEYNLRSIEHVDPKDLEPFTDEKAETVQDPLTDEDEKAFEDFLARVRNILGDRVTEVKTSSRLSTSPCCLVNPDGQMTSSMEKILKIVSKDTSIPKKLFELNKDHRLIRNLFSVYKADPNDEYLGRAIEQLFESSLLLEGYLTDPHSLVSGIQELLELSSGWYLRTEQQA